MAQTIVLISGCNRGLGKGLMELYLAKQNHTVIAANRDPTAASSKDLSSLPIGTGSRLIVVKVDASNETDALQAVKTLATEHDINHIDIVIANAGVSYIWPTVADLKTADLQSHMVPNVFGVVWLYQATLPLLLKSSNPKWITMGSGAGSIQDQLPMPNAAYGTSKAAVHWLTKRMNSEEEKLNAFVINPGFCKTTMGNAGARFFGFEEAFVEVAESCAKMVVLIDGATKEGRGGRMWDYAAEEVMAW